MKLADFTIYSDNDLTMPTTLNSIVTASYFLSPSPLSFLVLRPFGWSRDDGSSHPINNLSKITIIYRAPEEGQGPELIEPLEDIYLEETLMKVESFFKRVSDKVVDGIRAVLEAE